MNAQRIPHEVGLHAFNRVLDGVFGRRPNTRELALSLNAETIARELFHAARELRPGTYVENDWDELPAPERAHFRGVAERAIVGLEPTIVNRATRETTDAVVMEVVGAVGEDDPGRRLVERAIDAALFEFPRTLLALWRRDRALAGVRS